jgi:hypothetical protein
MSTYIKWPEFMEQKAEKTDCEPRIHNMVLCIHPLSYPPTIRPTDTTASTRPTY